jgi:putative ABC transport system substrate-binding protein
MRRRQVISLLGGAAAAWPLRVRAQSVPTIGFLRSGSAAGSEPLVAAFRRGLGEAGYVEGRNVAIEYRWAEGRIERLPALADDLVRRGVALIVGSASAAAMAAKAATSTVPIVFVTALDPVKTGLVANLARPGGNATGLTYPTSALAAKRVELARELVPTANVIAVLLNVDNPTTEPFMRDLRAGADAFRLEVRAGNVAAAADLAAVFARLAQHRPDVLLVAADPLFTAHAADLAALAARHALPAIYTQREFAVAGGLMSWGTSLAELYRLAGVYAGRILGGARPAELPVLQPAKDELVLNLKTARALGLDLPPTLLARADEAIE